MASWQSNLVRSFLKVYTAYRLSADTDIVQLRSNLDHIAKLGPTPPYVKTTKKTAGDISALEIKPDNAVEDCIILYLHGGAYNFCSYTTHKRLVSRICKASGITALIINYRLAPEDPYPAALEDALTAYKELLKQNYRHIILAGDSAGGGLTFALLMKLREENLAMPVCAVCISPWMDLTFSKWDTHHDAMLYKDALQEQAKNYYGDSDPSDPYISPLFGSFENFPPVLIQVSAAEALHNEVEQTVEKMKQQGVDITLQSWKDVVHVWHAYGFMPETKEANKKIGEFIRAHTG